LLFYDPLSDNSSGYGWGEGTDSTGGCQFTNGAYYVSASQGAEVCTDHSLNLNQTNVIAIVAKVSTFTLYVNKQQVDTITDGTYTNGLIGVAAIEKHTPTEVAYSNARVWTL
jgi:hypothetical protein